MSLNCVTKNIVKNSLFVTGSVAVYLGIGIYVNSDKNSVISTFVWPYYTMKDMLQRPSGDDTPTPPFV